MKIKKLLGMIAVDANAKDIGKIIDAEFNTENGNIEKIVISLKKSFLSNEKVEVDFNEVKSIGDYVLIDTVIEISDKNSNENESKTIETVEGEIVQDDK